MFLKLLSILCKENNNKMCSTKSVLVSICILFNVFEVKASAGDASPFQRHCIKTCFESKCSSKDSLQHFQDNQPFFESLFQWSCLDDCKYNCMWDTVDAFVKDGRKVPQFHGKWPFRRILGVQEPASALFSIFNLIPHVIMQIKLYNQIDHGK